MSFSCLMRILALIAPVPPRGRHAARRADRLSEPQNKQATDNGERVTATVTGLRGAHRRLCRHLTVSGEGAAA